jgi:hypothetical protein
MRNFIPLLDFKMANTKLSVKINRALLLLLEQKKFFSCMLFIYSLLKKIMNLLKKKIHLEKRFGGG